MFDNRLTYHVKFKTYKNLAIIKMDEEQVSIREFLRNYKDLSSKKKTIIILNRGKPEGVYIPYQEWKKDKGFKGKKFTRKELERFVISDPSLDSDLSQKIDEIIYKYPNPLKDEKDSND